MIARMVPLATVYCDAREELQQRLTEEAIHQFCPLPLPAAARSAAAAPAWLLPILLHPTSLLAAFICHASV